MKFRIEDGTFRSTDGIHNVHFSFFLPKEVKAIMVIVHGMYEFKERYFDFSEFLARNGIAAFCYDQLGHGKTVNDETEKGWFGENNGVEYIQGDVYKSIAYVKNAFPDKKIILFGHSMGSFIARYFAVNTPNFIDALVISGTNGGNSAVDMAIALSSFVSKFNGSKTINKTIDKLTMGGNNKKFEKEGETSPYAWISRDKNVQKECEKNSFVFTAQGFCDMFKMLKFISSGRWFIDFPKNLPVLLISGEDDPIGDFGKGVMNIYKRLKINKVSDVKIKLYPQCRHEPLNELNKDEVYQDILTWLDCKKLYVVK